jgi:hypothetical protein
VRRGGLFPSSWSMPIGVSPAEVILQQRMQHGSPVGARDQSVEKCGKNGTLGRVSRAYSEDVHKVWFAARGCRSSIGDEHTNHTNTTGESEHRSSARRRSSSSSSSSSVLLQVQLQAPSSHCRSPSPAEVYYRLSTCSQCGGVVPACKWSL